jgi:predicted NACHT family NTPase
MTDSNRVHAFNVSGLASALETFNEIVVIAPPGTGKTTTLLQAAEAILSQGHSVATFVPLGEWSSQSASFFQLVVRRHAFIGTREEHLKLLAHHSRLVLVLDGWNELDAASRKRAEGEIRSLRREFPGLGTLSAHGVKRLTCQFLGRWLRSAH